MVQDWGTDDDADNSETLSIDWSEIGDLVFEVIMMTKTPSDTFIQEAKSMGATVDQMAAAAIARLIQERVEAAFENYKNH